MLLSSPVTGLVASLCSHFTSRIHAQSMAKQSIFILSMKSIYSPIYEQKHPWLENLSILVFTLTPPKINYKTKACSTQQLLTWKNLSPTAGMLIGCMCVRGSLGRKRALDTRKWGEFWYRWALSGIRLTQGRGVHKWFAVKWICYLDHWIKLHDSIGLLSHQKVGCNITFVSRLIKIKFRGILYCLHWSHIMI